MSKYINVVSFSEYIEIANKQRNAIIKANHDISYHDAALNKIIENRNLNYKSFYFRVTLSGIYPLHDFLCRWCWENFGSCDGLCNSLEEFPGCPLVLETEYQEDDYKDVEKHYHSGVWKIQWIGKTGYDYGFSEFYFKNKLDWERFLAVVPTLHFCKKEKEYKMGEVLAYAVYQSKFGYHPIDKETYDKLRYLNSVYAKAQHLAAAWKRWANKHPSNRFLKRAIKDKFGVKIGSEFILDDNKQKIPWVEPNICSLFHDNSSGRVEDFGFGIRLLTASRQVKIPQSTPESVNIIEFENDQIDKLYQTAKEWCESFKK